MRLIARKQLRGVLILLAVACSIVGGFVAQMSGFTYTSDTPRALLDAINWPTSLWIPAAACSVFPVVGLMAYWGILIGAIIRGSYGMHDSRAFIEYIQRFVFSELGGVLLIMNLVVMRRLPQDI